MKSPPAESEAGVPADMPTVTPAGADGDTVSSRIAIRLRGVSRSFRDPRLRRTGFKDLVLGAAKPPEAGAAGEHADGRVHALRDVSLTAFKGEIIGIVGANGSGKSTLLRVIAGILEPDDGSVQVNGRVVGMIELGAGLHPDLTGEENIRLQGSILGLTAAQTEARTDEILTFAGLSGFRDDPVRHYSSGMTARLGFAIAIHADPEVLLADEVLAVGDVEFQSRCIAAMRELNARGVTIILVTHQTDLAEMFCSRLLWLDGGAVREAGDAAEVLQHWQEDFIARNFADRPGPLTRERVMVDSPGRFGAGGADIVRVRITDAADIPRRIFGYGSAIALEVTSIARAPLASLDCWAIIDHESGINVAWIPHSDHTSAPRAREGEEHLFRLDLGSLDLLPGRYVVTIALAPAESGAPEFDMHYRLHSFRIEADDAGPWNPSAPVRLRPVLRDAPEPQP